MLLTPSCKKGENDPALSLISRTARFSGTWDVTGYSATSINTEFNGDYQSSTSTLAENIITNSYSYYDADLSTTTTNSSNVTLNKAQIVIEKDGSWTQEWNTTTVFIDTVYDVSFDMWGEPIVTEIARTTSTVEVTTETGNWSFLGKVEDTYKNKERVVLNTLTSNSASTETIVLFNINANTTITNPSESYSSTDNYLSGEASQTFDIDQLKGKEMIWKTSESNSGTFSFTSGGTTTTIDDDVYTSEATWILSIVK